jgi:hypothetical protein
MIKKAMWNTTQQEFLKSAKDALGVTWDELAESAGINPRALKTYRMPDTSKDFRSLPALARAAVDRLVSGHKTRSLRRISFSMLNSPTRRRKISEHD